MLSSLEVYSEYLVEDDWFDTSRLPSKLPDNAYKYGDQFEIVYAKS